MLDDVNPKKLLLNDDQITRLVQCYQEVLSFQVLNGPLPCQGVEALYPLVIWD